MNASKLVLLLTLFVSCFAQAEDLLYNPYTAGGPEVSEIQIKLDNGQKVTAVQILAMYHEMDLLPGYAQPIIDQPYFIVKSTPDGQAALCEKWGKQVNDDEMKWVSTDTMFPYIEIAVTHGAKKVGTYQHEPVFNETDVHCWEAMDFGSPIY